ncbi:MAG TPA: GNAT family N-acetyltransferase [Iamia sp.]|nr:GNAT family N-acetyltransferase [Iamia sp.]
MRAEVVRPEDLGPAETARWIELQEADPELASPFLRPEMAVAIGRQWPDARVAVLHDGPEAVGFLPFHQGRLGAGRALGLGLTDWQGAILAPGTPWDAGALRRATGLAVWEFDHLVPSQAEALAVRPLALHASPVMDLSGGWDAWVARRAGSGRIKKALYHGRRLGRQVGPVESELDTSDPADLDVLMGWKSAQYRRTGRRDRFAQPQIRELVRDLVTSHTPGFTAHLSTMRVDGRTVAACLALRSHHVLAHWFPAYDTDLHRYQPGLVQLLEMVRLSAEDGVTTFDLGAGEHDYKDSFKDSELTVASGTVHGPGPAAWLHRARTVPPRVATDFVLAHPKLRQAARRGLQRVGTLRS